MYSFSLPYPGAPSALLTESFYSNTAIVLCSKNVLSPLESEVAVLSQPCHQNQKCLQSCCDIK